MAERRRLTRRKEMAFSAVAIGAVTASVGVNAATASPDYPTWDEVQNAQRSQASTQAEIDSLNGLLNGLESAAAEAGKQQQIAAEKYHLLQDALDAATAREAELARSAADAQARAKVSKMRAGLLAAHLARTAGGDVNLSLALGGDNSGLLDQLSAMGKLTEQSHGIYSAAMADSNLATSLQAQAESAKTERQQRAADAQKALSAANDASGQAQSALSEQQARQTELFAQLATLKNTTAEEEAAYRRGLAAPVAPPSAAPSVGPAPATPAASATAPPAPPTGSSGGTASGAASSGGSSTGGSSAGGSSAPAGGSSGGASAPSPDAVSTALAFARAQLGDMYVLNGYGPDQWDCSGLTKASYAAAGIYIGTHSATNQYNYAAANGRLVPWSQRQAGDLIFFTDGGGDMYHVAIYSGGGMMVEAPREGVPVRETPVRNTDRVDYVARPSA